MPLPFCSEQFHVYLSRKELGGIVAVNMKSEKRIGFLEMLGLTYTQRLWLLS